MHVTLRAVEGVPSLRTQRGLAAVHAAVAAVSRRDEGRTRIVHFSAQSNHLHLIVEGNDRLRVARAMQWLAARLARRLNTIGERTGRVWRDRYHRRDLFTRRAVRTALVYVLMNVRKHNARWAQPDSDGTWALDPYSSAPWFNGFTDPRAGPARKEALRRLEALERLGPYELTVCPIAEPKTWLVRDGWREAGSILVTSMPRLPAA
jgi:putative transposase